MTNVNRKALAGLMRMMIALPLLVFLPAWTLHYWQAWLCMISFFVPVTIITLILMKTDPELLERRITAGAGAEKEKGQKIIQSFGVVAFVAMFVVPALDHRFRWSQIPGWVAIAGDVLVVLGLAFVYLVLKENSLTSGVIEVEAGQRLVTSGPYALVRYPMYLGSLVMLWAYRWVSVHCGDADRGHHGFGHSLEAAARGDVSDGTSGGIWGIPGAREAPPGTAGLIGRLTSQTELKAR